MADVPTFLSRVLEHLSRSHTITPSNLILGQNMLEFGHLDPVLVIYIIQMEIEVNKSLKTKKKNEFKIKNRKQKHKPNEPSAINLEIKGIY